MGTAGPQREDPERMLVTIRDLAIIFIAIGDILLLILLIAIAFVVWRLLLSVKSEVPPIIGSVKRTATTIEGTADFVSTTAAMPLIRVVSLVFAVTRFLSVLLGQGTPREGGSR
jgi:hypothetical protein